MTSNMITLQMLYYTLRII